MADPVAPVQHRRLVLDDVRLRSTKFRGAFDTATAVNYPSPQSEPLSVNACPAAGLSLSTGCRSLGETRDDDRVQIRRADVADALQITDVHVRSWKVGYRGLLPQDVLDGLDPQQRVPRWEATIELSSWPAGGTLVAEEADRLVGFANLCPTRDVDQDPASVGEVASFYVSPEAWGQGVGRSLMEASSETLIAAGFLTASLWVLDTNARAIGFYRALGWRDDGAVKDDIVGGTPIRDLRYQRTLA